MSATPPPGAIDAASSHGGGDNAASRARALVADAPVGRLATVTAGGRPHLVPCCFALIADTVYSAVDGKPKSTTALHRLANIDANPGVCLLVDHYDEDWTALWWVRIDGSAAVLDPGEETERARDALRTKYRQYAAVALNGPVIRIDIRRWRWWP
jgi:PPOX class probable F420-dependent enzyme